MTETPDPSLSELVQMDTLQWIFVGGKGGVGKTTTSSSLAVLLANTPIRSKPSSESEEVCRKRQVLIISTDPAHNLRDAFNQSFTGQPTTINGFTNLFGMEIDPATLTEQTTSIIGLDKAIAQSSDKDANNMRGLNEIIQQAIKNMPGIDELTVFVEIMNEIQKHQFDVVVFDTAPTGHTLRLLSLPHTLTEAIDSVMNLEGLAPLLTSASKWISGGNNSNPIERTLSKWKEKIEVVQSQFKDHTKTTFVCVCIAEFLSVFETERLIQELMKYDISVENIVVNQLVLKPNGEADCRMCNSRQKIQGKYIEQINELYEDFHIVKIPLCGDEVRGVEALAKFSKFLITPYDANTHGYL